MTLASVIDRLQETGDRLPLGIALFIAAEASRSINGAQADLTPEQVHIADNGTVTVHGDGTVLSLARILDTLLSGSEQYPLPDTVESLLRTARVEPGFHSPRAFESALQTLADSEHVSADAARLAEYVRAMFAERPTGAVEKTAVGAFEDPAIQARRRRSLRVALILATIAGGGAALWLVLRLFVFF